MGVQVGQGLALFIGQLIPGFADCFWESHSRGQLRGHLSGAMSCQFNVPEASYRLQPDRTGIQ
jgi:hypothetical protein